ncbi:MAG: glycosyltransferase, partial [Acidobacteriota bacterium]|nr:glycosyltransferase [Acidobacteriota bacterium]
MRILITADPEIPVPPMLYGGIERIIDILVRELKSLGHVVGLIAHRDSQSPANNLFTWRGLHSQNKIDLIHNTSTLKRAINDFQPDIVHSFSRVMYLLPVLASSIQKIMSYQRPPSTRTVKYGSRLGRGTLSFTGCSDHISRNIRAAGAQARTIHNCVELNKYVYQPAVSDTAPLVFLSRIERIKGAHTAIKVAQKTGRRLIIAGNYVTDGEEGRYWSEEVLPHLGQNGIEYIGPVNDEQKNELLGQAAAMIVPIEWDEPFGIVFAEAMACGTPVISSMRGALPEIVRQGVDGFLVNNLQEACDAVNNLSLIKRIDCRQRIEQSFSSPVIVSRYE